MSDAQPAPEFYVDEEGGLLLVPDDAPYFGCEEGGFDEGFYVCADSVDNSIYLTQGDREEDLDIPLTVDQARDLARVLLATADVIESTRRKVTLKETT